MKNQPGNNCFFILENKEQITRQCIRVGKERFTERDLYWFTLNQEIHPTNH